MNIPQVHKLSKASQLSVLAVVILLGAVFFTVNSALQDQKSASNASGALNLLQNPSFENGLSPWKFMVTSGASGSISTTTSGADGEDAAQISITKANTSNWWYLQFSQYNIPTTAGQTYTVSFWAKASSQRTIQNVIQASFSPYKTYDYHNFNLTTSWQEYYYTFTTPVTQNTNFIGFNLASCTGTVWLSNVSYSVGGYTQSPTSTPMPAPTNPVPTLAPTGTPMPTVYYPTVYPTAVPTTPYYPTVSPTYVEPSISPTAAPTIYYPSISPTGSPVTTPTPTYVPQPTGTPVPGDTYLNFTIGLQGIGTAGDAVNPNSGGNMNPLHPTRTITATVYDAQNQLVATEEGSVTFNSTTGLFQGSVDLGSGVATGLYTVKVKTDQYLRSLVPGIQTITQGQTNTMPAVSLIAGDITGQNEINLTDYNVLIACYSDLEPMQDPTLCNQFTVNGFSMADLNDDGAVNQFDLNLFLRELSNVYGQ